MNKAYFLRPGKKSNQSFHSSNKVNGKAELWIGDMRNEIKNALPRLGIQRSFSGSGKS